MNNFLKLVHFELKRFSKLYMGLIAIIAVAQLLIALIIVNMYASDINRMLAQGKSSFEILGKMGKMSIGNIMNNNLFYMTLMVGAIPLIIYMFFIWYRDWFGKSSFIYRLLMLPTNRMNLFYSKAVAMFLFIFGLVAVQVLLLQVEHWIIGAIVPRDYNSNLDFLNLIDGSPLTVILPPTLEQFFLSYGVGAMLLVTLFTAVLLERSFRLRGIVIAILYCVVAGVVFFIPLFIQNLTEGYFYHKEEVWALIVSGLVVTICGITLSNYLLKRKITV